MASKLSFAGVSLLLESPQHQQWLEEIHPRQDFMDFDGWNFDQPGFYTSHIPTPSIPIPPYFKVNTLYWPTGSVRPAWFHSIVNRDKLDAIRCALTDPMTPAPLVMYDGIDGHTVTARMYFLPPRPLNQLGHTSSDLWLLSLTDQRFFWHWRRGNLTVPGTWTALYSAIASILGISINVDPINPSYGTPSPKWTIPYGPSPVILDSIAEQVGQRIVVSLDGTISAVNWRTAKNNVDTYLGGSSRLMSGGRIPVNDIGRYVPERVDVLFVNTSVSPVTTTPYVVSKYLRNLTTVASGLLASGSCLAASAMSGYVQTLYADTPYSGATGIADDYAQAAAEDWYGWRETDLDVVYPGIEPWAPTGWEDSIEWTMQLRSGNSILGTGEIDTPFSSTKIQRGPWNQFTTGDWFAGQIDNGNNDTSGNCEPHGWLLDRQALIDTNKYFDVQVFAGAGRCACIVDQGRDPGGFPYPWQAKYNATANKWLLMEKIKTCCDDCVQLKLDVDDTTGVMTGQLVGNIACDASGAFTYNLVEMCSGRGFVKFGAAGVKLCNTVLDPNCIDDKCDNSFTILVTCDCCNNTNVACDRCCTCTGPPFVLFNLTGFSGANAFLNALWVLPYQGNCTWGFTCNGTTFAYAITYDGVNTTHLTFTISGIATYEYDIVAGDTQISCFVNRTLTRTSGDAGSTPSTVLMEPFTCDTTPSACFKGVSTSDQLFFQFHDCTGDAACLNGLVVPLTYGVGSCAGTGLSSWQGTFSDCTAPGTTGDICITCNTGGDDNTCPLVMNINFKDGDCTGPFGIVSWTCDPFVLEVQYSNFCFFGAMKGRFTTTHP